MKKINIKNFLTLNIIICTTIAVVIIILPPIHAANWQTVTTVTGSSDKTTSTFAITSSEWRIQWSYTPDSQDPQSSGFYFFVYPQGETAHYIDSVSSQGNTQTSSPNYIYQGNGNYYLKIIVTDIPSYSITIQQNQTSNELIIGAAILLVIVLIIIAIVLLLERGKKPQIPKVRPQIEQRARYHRRWSG